VKKHDAEAWAFAGKISAATPFGKPSQEQIYREYQKKKSGKELVESLSLFEALIGFKAISDIYGPEEPEKEEHNVSS